MALPESWRVVSWLHVEVNELEYLSPEQGEPYDVPRGGAGEETAWSARRCRFDVESESSSRSTAEPGGAGDVVVTNESQRRTIHRERKGVRSQEM